MTSCILPEDAARLRTIVKDFREKEGPQIDGMLREYAKGHLNYVEKFWNAMYVLSRAPLPVNVSPGVLFVQSCKSAHNRQLLKAARFSSHIAQIKDLIELDRLEPDFVRGVPLCMWEYQILFARNRIPGLVAEGGDQNLVVSTRRLTETADTSVVQLRKHSRNCLVMKRNRFFTIDMYHPDGSVLSTLETLRELERIDEICKADGVEGPRVGVLTGADRELWANARIHLKGLSEANAASLKTIEEAMFVICLDENTPDPTGSTALAHVLHGDNCNNRWYDKSAQIFVCRNGVAGMQFEHSACDAWPYIRTLVQLTADMHAEDYGDGSWYHHTAPVTTISKDRLAEHKFELDDKMNGYIAEATAQTTALCSKVAVRFLTFSNFGKDHIVKQKVSPDAVLQAALCLAYFRVRGQEMPITYSASGTKQYLHGRTECVRTSCNELKSFLTNHVKLFGGVCEPGLDVESGSKKATKVNYGAACNLNRDLRKWVELHCKKMIEAKFGNGCDRHLFALMCIAKEVAKKTGTMPALFTDPTFAAAMDFTLSTSNVPPNPHALSQVFGPVSDRGFGVCYSVYNGHMTFGLTGWKDASGGSEEIDEFKRQLERALNEIAYQVLPAQTMFDRSKEFIARNHMKAAYILTAKLGWLTRLPIIGFFFRNFPIVNRLLTFKMPGASRG